MNKILNNKNKINKNKNKYKDKKNNKLNMYILKIFFMV